MSATRPKVDPDDALRLYARVVEARRIVNLHTATLIFFILALPTNIALGVRYDWTRVTTLAVLVSAAMIALFLALRRTAAADVREASRVLQIALGPTDRPDPMRDLLAAEKAAAAQEPGTAPH